MDIDEVVSAEVRRETEVFGVRVGSIAIRDIILPGDIREILNQVVTAEKQAQANLIRRREEIAATRSLLNTAKLMEVWIRSRRFELAAGAHGDDRVVTKCRAGNYACSRPFEAALRVQTTLNQRGSPQLAAGGPRTD